jgi:hypothetical protein
MLCAASMGRRASHALTPRALAAQCSAAAARARSAASTPRHRAPAGALALAARPLMTAISAASTRPGGHASSHASHAPFAQPLGVTCARLERARTKLASCPDDLEAWEAVLAEARTRPLAEARQLYDSVRPPRLQQCSCALRGCTQLLRRGISGRCARRRRRNARFQRNCRNLTQNRLLLTRLLTTTGGVCVSHGHGGVDGVGRGGAARQPARRRRVPRPLCSMPPRLPGACCASLCV